MKRFPAYITIAFCALSCHATPSLPAGFGAPSAQPKIVPARLAHPLRLMSFNIRMGCGHNDPFNLAKGSLGHLPACAEAIRSIKPDVVGIQEVDCKSRRAGFVDQTAELAKLAGMEGAWVEKIPQYGIAVLFREKPLAVTKTLIPGKIHTRVLQIVEFKDYIVANTHFPLSETTRTNAARIVIEKLKGAAKPVFLMGDFNASPASETIRMLKEDFVLLSGDCWPTSPARTPKETIDYIFVDKAHAERVNVRSHGVESFPDATDHCAVWVDVEPTDGVPKKH